MRAAALAPRPLPADNGAGERVSGLSMLRAFVRLAGALSLCLALSGCDKCGDPVKFNFPGFTACRDTN